MATTARSENALRLKQRLRSQLRWLRLRLLGHAALMLLGGLGLLLAAAVATSTSWFALGPVGAHVVRFALVALALWVLVFEVVFPLRRVANLKGFSRALEEHGEYGNLLEAATQFTSPRRKDPLAWGASPRLVEEILRRAREEAEATKLTPRIPLVGAPLHVVVALVALLAWAVLGVARPDAVRDSFAALRTPGLLSDAPPEEGIYATTGDLKVAIGGALTLTARDLVGGDDPVVLEMNHSADFWQEVPTRALEPAMDPAPFVDVAVELTDIEDPFRYRFRKGEILSREHSVSVRERPVIKELAATLAPPAYTGRPTVDRDDLGGTIGVLEGTRVTLRGRASTTLRRATRLEQDADPVELTVEGDRFTDELTIGQDTSFRIALEDSEGLKNDGITVYRFVAQSDDPPTVQLTEPAEDLTLDRDLVTSIAGLAADDVGLARIDLLYRNSEDTEWSRLPLVPDRSARTDETVSDLQIERGENEVALGFRWDLSNLELFPGDTMLYCLEATDNNALVGGQSARSSVYRLRLPTIAEVFDLEREERAEQGDDLTEILEEGEELQETLERLNRELKKNPTPDWAKQQEIRDALERQQALQEKLAESAEELAQNLDNFEKNNAGSMELLEKMETIQDLMESLQDESLQAYMDAMNEAMEEIRPHELQRAMEEALESQEDHNRRLDRTIELLRQLERERVMSDLVEEVAEYLDRQRELEEQTNPEDADTDAAGEDPEGEQDDPGDGENSETGEPQDGENSDGENQEGEPQDGGSEDGENQEGEPQDGESEDGENQDGESQDGESQDGENQESKDGESQSGENQDGQNQDSQSGEQNEEPSLTEEELAEIQQKLREEAEQLEQRLREQFEELKKQQEEGGSSDPSAQEMRQALEEALEQMAQEGKSSESMEEAESALRDGDRQDAQQQQQEAQRKLVHLYEVLAEGQQSMQMASAQTAVEKLQQTAYDLLNLSFGEEKVIESLEGTTRGQRLTPITREQGRIQRNVARISDDLHELARKNFMINEQLLLSMRNLVELLERSVEELQLSRSRRSRNTATSTMGEMNRIVMNLLTTAMNAGGQGGGSGQQMSMSQQMQQMSQDQSRLNAMTQELRKKLQNGGLSQQERERLAQLRARQQMIQQQLQEMRQQIDDERRVLGDLGELSDEIDDVMQDLDGGRLSQDLERKQEKILSRMLDAQRSIREREFTKRREAREGDDLYATQEGEVLLGEEDERERQLRRWLAPERAPHAYQDDVRRYFRSIQGQLDGGSRE